MITAGDEMGRTQLGNNNAYCQDTPISWVDWKLAEDWAGLTELTADLTKLRATSRLLTYDDYLYRSEILDAHGQSLQRYNLAWMNGYSGEMQTHDWQDNGRRLLGMYLSSRTEALLIWFYSGAHPIHVTMPGSPWGWGYTLAASTAEPGELPTIDLLPGDSMTLPGRTVVVLKVKVPSDEKTLRKAMKSLTRGGRREA